MIATKYSSIPKRFAAFIADVLICILLANVLSGLFHLIMRPVYFFSGLFEKIHLGNPAEWMVNHIPIWVPHFMEDFPGWTFLIIYVAYYALFEGSWRQATPGKVMMKIFVTDLNGKRLSYQRALARSICRVVSGVICFIGFLIALLTSRSQALHDKVVDTLVLEEDARYGPPEV